MWIHEAATAERNIKWNSDFIPTQPIWHALTCLALPAAVYWMSRSSLSIASTLSGFGSTIVAP